MFLSLLLITLSSCTQINMKRVEKSNSQDHYLRSGIQEYYLSGLPEWANFSSTAQCRRKHSTYYFDLRKISKSFNFDYKQSVQFQLSFNKNLAEYHTKFLMKELTLKDEEIVFYTIKDHIKGEDIYIAFNTAHHSTQIVLPDNPPHYHWVWVVNTNASDDFRDPDLNIEVENHSLTLAPYSAILLIRRDMQVFFQKTARNH